MRAIIFACVLIGIAAVLAPTFIRQTVLQSHGPNEAAEAAPARASIARGTSTVEVKAARDGHFYLDAEVNWRDVRFMVDTGATVVALRASDAAAAGVRVTPADFDQPVGTANGTTYAAEVHLDTISVDDVAVESVRALVLQDDQLQISLLGGSFLNQLKRFAVESGTLVLEN